MAAAALVQTCTPDAAFERPRKLFLEPGGSGSHPQSEEEIKYMGRSPWCCTWTLCGTNTQIQIQIHKLHIEEVTVMLHVVTVWHFSTGSSGIFSRSWFTHLRETVNWFSSRYSREGFVVGCLLRITFVPLVFPAFVLHLGSTVLHRDRSRLGSSRIPALFDRVAVAKLLRHCLTHRLVGVPGQ